MKHDLVYYERDIKPLLTPEEREFELAYRSIRNIGWGTNELYKNPTYSIRDIITARAQTREAPGSSITWGDIKARLRGAF